MEKCSSHRHCNDDWSEDLSLYGILLYFTVLHCTVPSLILGKSITLKHAIKLMQKLSISFAYYH